MNLTGRPIYVKGQKADKPRKGMRPVSAKKAKHKATEKAAGGTAHMMAVKALGCLICGAQPAEAHHLPDPRSDFRTIALCPFHHRTEYGEQAYHFSRRNFNKLHGSDEKLLARTLELLNINKATQEKDQ